MQHPTDRHNWTYSVVVKLLQKIKKCVQVKSQTPRKSVDISDTQ